MSVVNEETRTVNIILHNKDSSSKTFVAIQTSGYKNILNSLNHLRKIIGGSKNYLVSRKLTTLGNFKYI